MALRLLTSRVGVLLVCLFVCGACDRLQNGSRLLTFNQDVAPILFENCASCHRPDQSAPFSVLEYSSVRTHARAIADVTRRRTMPPWLPESGYGDFADSRRLSESQIRTIERWVEQGAAEGDSRHRPTAPTWTDDWQLGKPDLIIKMPKPYSLSANGPDVFRNFVIPLAPSSKRYVRAVEFHAGNPKAIHHATIGFEPRRRVTRGTKTTDDEVGSVAMPENETKIFGWSPGKRPVMKPADMGWILDESSDIVLELHMVPTGKPELVQPTVGLFFTDTPPSRVPALIKLESKTIDIAAGNDNYVATDTYVLPVDVDVQSVYPHAHYLATDVKGIATLPDGTTKWLVWIKAWNFRWQDEYRYIQPVFLPKGTTVSMRFTYDNSNRNVHNPRNPPTRVINGPLSSDEMAVLWLEVLPRRPENTGVLARDFVQRELRADVAGAQLRVAAAPNDAPARTFLAMKEVAAGEVQDAVKQLQMAVTLDPNDAEAHNDLGSILQSLGQIEEAKRHLFEAVRLNPDDAREHFNLGNAMVASGDASGAVLQYRLAIQLDPDDGDAHYNLASILNAQRRTEEAINHLRAALAIDPLRSDAHHNLVLALSSEGRFDDALSDIRSVLAIQPDSVQAQHDLVLVQQLRQRANSTQRD